MEPNTVTLSVTSYNQTKADNYRLNMFLDSVFNEAMISEDHEHLVFSTSKIEDALKFCFPERCKKKLSILRTQNTRYGTHIAPNEEKNKCTPEK